MEQHKKGSMDTEKGRNPKGKKSKRKESFKVVKEYIYVFLSVWKKEHTQQISSDDNEEATPVSMPNTEVKLLSAENTSGLPCWEDRKSLDFLNSSLAQLVERSAVNR